MSEDSEIPELSASLARTDEFVDAVEEAAEAIETLQDAMERLQEASISVEDPFGGPPREIAFDDVYDLRVAINIQSTRASAVICPTCERRVWGSDRRDAMHED